MSKKSVIGIVITNNGDGSNGLRWFPYGLTDEEQDALYESDFDLYGSGDGFQYTEIEVPDVEEFVKSNPIKFFSYN